MGFHAVELRTKQQLRDVTWPAKPVFHPSVRTHSRACVRTHARTEWTVGDHGFIRWLPVATVVSFEEVPARVIEQSGRKRLKLFYAIGDTGSTCNECCPCCLHCPFVVGFFADSIYGSSISSKIKCTKEIRRMKYFPSDSSEECIYRRGSNSLFPWEHALLLSCNPRFKPIVELATISSPCCA